MKYFLQLMTACTCLYAVQTANLTEAFAQGGSSFSSPRVRPLPEACADKHDGKIIVEVDTFDPLVSLKISIKQANNDIVDTTLALGEGNFVQDSLPAGDYTVQVAQGTQTSRKFPVTIQEQHYSITGKPVHICPAASTGSITLDMENLNHQTPTFDWEKDGKSIASPSDLSKMDSGVYVVTMTVNGCEVKSDPFTLKKLHWFKADTVLYDVTCHEPESGSIVFKNISQGGSMKTDGGQWVHESGIPFLYSVWKDDSYSVPPTNNFQDQPLPWPFDSIYGLPGGHFHLLVTEEGSEHCDLLEPPLEFDIDTIKRMPDSLFTITPTGLSMCNYPEGKGDGFITIETNGINSGSFGYWYQSYNFYPADSNLGLQYPDTIGFRADDDNLDCNRHGLPMPQADGNPYHATICSLPADSFMIQIWAYGGCLTDTLTVKVEKLDSIHPFVRMGFDTLSTPLTRCDFPHLMPNGIDTIIGGDGTLKIWNFIPPGMSDDEAKRYKLHDGEQFAYMLDHEKQDSILFDADDSILKNTKDTVVIDSLAERRYTVFLRSTNGCVDTAFSVTIQPRPPTEIDTSATAPTGCWSSDGKITLRVTPPGDYSYKMLHGTDIIDFAKDDTTDGLFKGSVGDGDSLSATIYNLAPGRDTIIVIPAGGCKPDTVAVTVPDPNVGIDIKDSLVPPTRCNFPDGEGDGLIYLTVNDTLGLKYYFRFDGSKDSLSFGYDNSAVPNCPRATADRDSLKAVICGVAAGEHEIIVMAEDGCPRDTFTINMPTHDTIKLHASFELGDSMPTCIGRSDGRATITVENGTPKFTLEALADGMPWYADTALRPAIHPTGIDSIFTVDTLTAGTYTFVVTDAGECSDTTRLTFEADTAIQIEATLNVLASSCTDDKPLNPRGGIEYIINNITCIGTTHYDPDTTHFLVYLDGKLKTEAPDINLWSRHDTINEVESGRREIAFRLMYAVHPDSGCLQLDTVEVKQPDVPHFRMIDDELRNPECIGLKTGAFGIQIVLPSSRSDTACDYHISRKSPDATAFPLADSLWKRPYLATNVPPDTIFGKTVLRDDTISYGYGIFSAHFRDLDTGSYSLWLRDTLTKCVIDTAVVINAPQRLTLDSLTSFRLLSDPRTCDVETTLSLEAGSKDIAASYSLTLWMIDTVAPRDTTLLTLVNNKTDTTFHLDVDTIVRLYSLRDAAGCALDTFFAILNPRPVKVWKDASRSLITCTQDTTGFIKLKGRRDDYIYEWHRIRPEGYRDAITSTTDSVGGLSAGIDSVAVTDAYGLCRLDTTFETTASHKVDVQIIPPVTDIFCPGDEFQLVSRITVAPLVPKGDSLTAFWHFAQSDSLVGWEALSPSIIVTADTSDTAVLLVATYHFADDTLCTSRDTFAYIVRPTPSFAFEDDSLRIPVNEEQQLKVIWEDTAFVNFSWVSTPEGYTEGLPSYPNDLSNVMIAYPDRDYRLRIELEASNGCRVSDSVYIRHAFEFFIPNAFTPNGDGIHDYWRLFPLNDYATFFRIEASVFTRSGALVFQSRDYGNAPPNVFDGRKGGHELPIGTYYYVVKLVHRTTGAEELFTGSLTIIR